MSDEKNREEEMRERAENFLNSIEINRTPMLQEWAAVWDWPWRPFSEHSAGEYKDIQVRGIRSQLLKAGKNWSDKVDRKMIPHLAEGHMGAVQEVGGVQALIETFVQHFEEWDPMAPDWRAVEKVLLSKYQVPPSVLRDLSLIDIRRYLSTEPAGPKDANNKQLSQGRKKKSGRIQRRKLTKTQMEILAMSINGMSVSAIAESRGKTRQSIDKTLKSARKNQGFLTEKSQRSAKAVNNVERLEQRAKRVQDDE